MATKIESNVEVGSEGLGLFSSNALVLLNERLRDYRVQMISESVKEMKRHQAETVSVANVQHASEHLISTPTQRFFGHVGTLGGILLGASISAIVSMTFVSQYTTAGIVFSAALGFVGAFMVALHVAKD